MGLAGLAAAVVPAALAASQNVRAVGNSWDHSQVAITPGESVTFDNPVLGGGTHNLWIDGTQVQGDGNGWSYTANGLGAGQHSFQCTLHANMVGTIYVNDAGTVPAQAPPTTTTAPTVPTATTGPPSGGGAGGQAPTSSEPAPSGPPPLGPGPSAATVSLARRALGTFCAGGPGCRKPGVVVRLELSAPATVKIALTRGRRAAGSVSKAVGAGTVTLRFARTSKGRLKTGSYRGSVTATPTAGGGVVAVGNITFEIR